MITRRILPGPHSNRLRPVARMLACVAFAFVFAGSAARAETCNRWAPESVMTGVLVTQYAHQYEKYLAGKLSEAAFVRKSQALHADLMALNAHVTTASSCSHPSGKYRARQEALVKIYTWVLPLVAASRALAADLHRALMSQLE